ncbi:Cytochrome b-c1 complex subunit 8, mitochondrial [Sporothrix bragantina]|uniref:Cytochrome b-c1 complex subunit 8 n=1 Tax=Sporothrix bragantina TaxID=671064 RepID=A0ABP0BJ16_9PEZI
MRPSQMLRSGGGGDTPLGKYGQYGIPLLETLSRSPLRRTTPYIGNWGGLGPATQKQRGIVSFGIAPNRQNPFAGAGHDAVFNTWRRFSRQVLYWAPPFIAGYYIMQWATERNHFLNSKHGRVHEEEE